jgi:hypothetical protein
MYMYNHVQINVVIQCFIIIRQDLLRGLLVNHSQLSKNALGSSCFTLCVL